tara:strand:- start:387 stop:665 length:279 start_codon:yes stop_codon:yes gene_type:complete
MTWWLVGAEVILIMAAFGTCCGGLIHTWCASQRRSRCSSFSCCCGLISCVRQVESDTLMEAELAAEALEQHGKPRARSNSNDNDEPPPSTQV